MDHNQIRIENREAGKVDILQSADQRTVEPSIYQRGAWWIVFLLCLALTFTAFAPLLPVDWWWIRIGDFPRVQLLISYVTALLVLILFRQNLAAKPLSYLLLASIGIQIFWIFPYLPVAPHEVQWAQSQDKQRRLRILTANVLQKNQSASALLNLISQEDPDVVVLCEVNDRWILDSWLVIL